MEQLVTSNLRGRKDNAAVQKTVDGCQQVLAIISLVRRLVEVLKQQTEDMIKEFTAASRL